MEGALNTAYSVLPALSRDELRQLQTRITELLGEKGASVDPLIQPRREAEWEAVLDAAIAEFDSGKGYDAGEMCRSIRERFGWANA